MKLFGNMDREIKHISTMIFQHQDCIEQNAHTVVKMPIDNHEFMEIIKHLVQEKKGLQERLDVMEEILHSMLPVIGEDDKEKE